VKLLIAGNAGSPGARTIRAVVGGLDPQLAVEVTRLEDNLEQWRAPSKLVAALSAALAGLALVLACTGVFGTVAYTVSRRVREIGIRVALGAAHEDVLRLIVRQGMRPVVIGIVIGLAGAAAASTVFANMLRPEPARSDLVRDRAGRVPRDCPGRVLHPRAPRTARRADDRAADRVTRPRAAAAGRHPARPAPFCVQCTYEKIHRRHGAGAPVGGPG